jgi:hypothetical protein
VVNGEWVWKSKWRESYSNLVTNLNLQIVLTIHYSPLTMKYTQSSLDKLEKIVEEAGYVVRYERGTFQSGYCILEQKKVVVLNKFLQTEGRINTLIDLIPQLDIQSGTLSEESKKIRSEISSKLETKENNN